MEFKKGDKVVVAHAYYGGHYAYGTLLKKSDSREIKGQWLVDIGDGVLPASEERLMLESEFISRQDKKLATEDKYIGSMEYEITSYILHHKDGIKEHLQSTAVLGYIKEQYVDEFEQAVVDEVVELLYKSLNTSYQEVACIVDKNFLVELCGKDFFML